jgi:hypothetical protein
MSCFVTAGIVGGGTIAGISAWRLGSQATAVTAMGVTEKGIAVANSQLGWVKKGLYVLAAGVGLAGAIALGGAIYGAVRKENTHSLGEFKGRAVQQ